jgi:uncharacterized OsmC-like protein
LRDSYRSDPDAARITLRATGNQQESPLSCSVDIGRAVYAAQAHRGVGGPGTAACSGDLLLGALAACAQITCQTVAAASNIEVDRLQVNVEGDLDLRGTLGLSREVPVGFSSIRTTFDIEALNATEEQIESLKAKTERYCVVLQTLQNPARMETTWEVSTVAKS